eukprot:TRINITY_DN5510_c0_g4_i2.p1 TRINITY_DN5510_c0_g4~~TRINITY_DN5510_c0_g4_i2.p1  ORF type:complete len:382 (+),score=118.33 TRINITY_DN5510_c0_g4_i2:169-1314(+)
MKEESKVGKKYCTKGWNWGNFVLDEKALSFNVENKPCFGIPFNSIANAGFSKDEVTIELHQDEGAKEPTKNDVVCELRFYIPNTAHKGDTEEDRKDTVDAPEKPQAELFFHEVMKKVNVDPLAGDAIVSFQDLPLITPRGKYSLDMYQQFLKFHGRTHNFKVLYKNISRVFALPKPDGQHIGFVIGLTTPIKQGQTFYPFIVLQFRKDASRRVRPNFSTEQIKEQFAEKLEGEIGGPLHDVLSRVFSAMVGIKIIVPTGFKSTKDAPAVFCSVKALDGHLYPLEKSLLFVNKPVVYIRLADIQFVEFARVGQSAAQTNRSFDLNVVVKQGETFQFVGVDRNEYGALVQYVQSKKIPIRNTEAPPTVNAIIDKQLVRFCVNM